MKEKATEPSCRRLFCEMVQDRNSDIKAGKHLFTERRSMALTLRHVTSDGCYGHVLAPGA